MPARQGCTGGAAPEHRPRPRRLLMLPGCGLLRGGRGASRGRAGSRLRRPWLALPAGGRGAPAAAVCLRLHEAYLRGGLILCGTCRTAAEL